MSTSIGAQRLARLVGSFDRRPAYRGLAAVLRELIGDGRIPAGTRLPSERSLTGALAVSRTTVTGAYAELVASGFAVARQGAGTFAAVPLDRRRTLDRALRPLFDSLAGDSVVDLTCATSTAVPGVAAAYERASAALPMYLATDGYLPSGLPDLQAAIADTFVQRGLPTDPEQIIITSGAMSAVAIVARALSRRGDRIVVESPVYSNAIDALRLGGGRLISSPLADPLGDAGWDLDGIAATLQQATPRFGYLIPDFQNPTGFLMDDATRDQYAAMLRRAGTTAIVDETLQATGHTADAMPAPLATRLADAITIGSCSKLFWGGLRVGWIRAPRAVIPALVAARVRVDLGTSLFDQLVAIELLAARDTLGALRRVELCERREALAASLAGHLPDWRFRPPAGGLTLWVQLPASSATQLAADLERSGTYVAPGPMFAVDGGADSWLRLPFTRPPAELDVAVQRIAEHWPSTGRARRRPAARVLIS